MLFYSMGFFWWLSTVPDSYNPDSFVFDAVKESIGRNDDFSKWEVFEFRWCSAGLGKLFQPGQDFSRLVTKRQCRSGIFPVEIGDCSKKLSTT